MKDTYEEIAELAGIFSDPTRVRIVALLMASGEGLTTLDICARLGLAQPRVSSHLARLLKGDVVSVAERGRQRVYSLSSTKAAAVLEDLGSLAAPKKRRSLLLLETPKNASRASSEIRECRTCYDHLAGVAGVELLKRMLDANWLAKQSGEGERKILYRLTRTGTRAMLERGVDVSSAESSKRTFAYGCLDWTENQPHLGGALGSAVLDCIIADGIVERKIGTRAMKVAKPVAIWVAGQRK
jgi:DNA-binding transcriptional ArsR family regulator